MRRYWEHLIRNDDDLARHVDYIHHNPVKHGLTADPFHWRSSSIHVYALVTPTWTVSVGQSLMVWCGPRHPHELFLRHREPSKNHTIKIDARVTNALVRGPPGTNGP